MNYPKLVSILVLCAFVIDIGCAENRKKKLKKQKKFSKSNLQKYDPRLKLDLKQKKRTVSGSDVTVKGRDRSKSHIVKKKNHFNDDILGRDEANEGYAFKTGKSDQNLIISPRGGAPAARLAALQFVIESINLDAIDRERRKYLCEAIGDDQYIYLEKRNSKLLLQMSKLAGKKKPYELLKLFNNYLFKKVKRYEKQKQSRRIAKSSPYIGSPGRYADRLKIEYEESSSSRESSPRTVDDLKEDENNRKKKFSPRTMADYKLVIDYDQIYSAEKELCRSSSDPQMLRQSLRRQKMQKKNQRLKK